MKSQNVRKDGLSPLQRRAVAALVTSKTQRAAAASLGIAERTLARWVSNELLYQSYGAWCKDNGVSPKGQRTLAQSLQAKGLTTGAQKKVSGVNHRGVEGLDLAIRQAV